MILQDSGGSYETRFEVDYGKFHRQSYLATPVGFKKGPSWNPSEKYRSPNFHRPGEYLPPPPPLTPKNNI